MLGEQRTVAELLDAWYEHGTSRVRSITTLREYQRLIDRLKPASVTSPSSGSPDATSTYYDELIAGGLAPATVRQVHAVMRGALGQAVKWDWLDADPALEATPPPLRRPAIPAPGPEEVRLLIVKAQARDPAFGLFLRLAVVTGARRGELCALRWSDVDLDAAAVTVARSMAEGRAVGSSRSRPRPTPSDG